MSLQLKNRTILITRSRSQSPEFRQLLEHEGARVLEIPTIEIQSRPSPQLDRAIQNLDHYQWLIFTSAHGVQIFMERAQELGIWSGWPDSISFPSLCSIGPATAKRVEEYGFQADLVPSRAPGGKSAREVSGAVVTRTSQGSSLSGIAAKQRPSGSSVGRSLRL